MANSKLTFILPTASDLADFSYGSGFDTAIPISVLQDMQPSTYIRGSNDSCGFYVNAVAASLAVQTSWDSMVMTGAVITTATTLGIKYAASQGVLLGGGGTSVFSGTIFPYGPQAEYGYPTYSSLLKLSSAINLSTNPWIQLTFGLAKGSLSEVQIGRVFFGTRYEFTYNPAWGFENGRNPADLRLKSNFGGTQGDKRLGPRYWKLPMQWMSQVDAENFCEDLLRVRGIAKDFFVFYDIDLAGGAQARWYQRAMQATLVNAPRIQRTRFNMWQTILECEEVV